MNRIPAFRPADIGVTVSVLAPAAPAAAGRVKFDAVLNPGAKSRKVRLYNAGPSLVFFELVGVSDTGQPVGDVNVNTGVPLAVDREIILETAGATYLAAICQSGNATLYATPGEGGGT